MEFEQRWYWCEISEAAEAPEPDWSKVPEHKREAVRTRWLTSRFGPATQWQLWGPQIGRYMQRADMRVSVVCAA